MWKMINTWGIFRCCKKLVYFIFYYILIMKKTILVSLVLCCGVMLTACWKKADNEEWNVVVVDPECVKAVESYLSWADMKWEWEEIKAWDNIVVDYIWRLKDWTVFDTSIQSVAEACGVYSEGRDYTEWLPFEVWAWQMIEWFDKWVVWMKLWQTKTVEFWPEEWYGERDEQLVVSFSKQEVGDLSLYQVWQTIYVYQWFWGVITKITDKEMVVDFNHELAWKDLIFDVTVKSIN